MTPPAQPPAMPSPPTTTLPAGTSRAVFAYSSLDAVTGGFSEERRLGSGGSGSVYRAVLDCGTPVAIKRFHGDASTKGGSTWHTELAMLSQTSHTNLVRAQRVDSQPRLPADHGLQTITCRPRPVDHIGPVSHAETRCSSLAWAAGAAARLVL